MGMFGLANMFEFLNEVRQIAPELEVAGIAVTKVDTRKNYFKQTMEILHQLENIHVFDNPDPCGTVILNGLRTTAFRL